MAQRRKLSLAASIAAAFSAAVVPTLIFILAYSYRANSGALYRLSESYSRQASADAIAAAQALLQPVESTLRLVAELAGEQPAYFRSEKSRDYLYQALISADQIDALYTSFEDGYHRVVTRVDDDRRRSDPQIPASAHWHSSWINPYGTGPRVRHRTFFDRWPHVIKRYDVPWPQDVRAMPHYQECKRTRAVVVGDAVINPDTRAPIITVGAPILSGGRFIGVASANITFDVLSVFLDKHRPTPHSLTVIVDADNRIVAHPDPRLGVTKAADGSLVFAPLSAAGAPLARAAEEQKRTGKSSFRYRAGEPAREYLAVFTPFPAGFGKPWRVLTVTPTEDILGALKRSNRRLSVLIAMLIVLELVLIVVLSTKLAEPILAVSRDMQSLRALSFGSPRKAASPIREVAELEGAVSLLQHSLKSFAAYVPIGVVRRLVASGKPVQAAVEARELTLLFTDLENFTTACETLDPADLSEHLSGYFEEATSAVRTEGGTVDKFIGDAVMAFWGAPAPIKNQVERACCAALRIAARVRRLNEWAPEGRRMNVRIGLHHGRALVGNIGSSDRLSYTAIGDAVNVAARLESINKEYGTTICISDAVYAEVKDKIVARPLQVVKVRGRKSELRIYELLGMRGASDPELSAPEKEAA